MNEKVNAPMRKLLPPPVDLNTTKLPILLEMSPDENDVLDLMAKCDVPLPPNSKNLEKSTKVRFKVFQDNSNNGSSDADKEQAS